MSPLVFLGMAVGLSLVGVLLLWVRNRTPRSVDAHIRAFSRELEALAPDQQQGTTPPTPPGPSNGSGADWPQPIAPQPIAPQPLPQQARSGP